MPADTKRVAGPESTLPYRLYSKNNTRSTQDLCELVLDGDERRGSRTLQHARTMHADLGPISQAKGSAYIENGNTKVIVGVYEPRELPKQATFDNQGELYCDVKFAPFSNIKRVQLIPGNEERDMAAALRRALEPAVLRHLFANFQIDIFAYVLENDGSCLSTLINAAGLALADAEIPMYDSIVAVTFGIQGDYVFVDPTLDEEQYCLCKDIESVDAKNHGIIVKVLLPEQDQVTELWQCGSITLDLALKVLDSYSEVYKLCYMQMRTTLSAKCKKALEKIKKTRKNTADEDKKIDKLLKSIRDEVQIV